MLSRRSAVSLLLTGVAIAALPLSAGSARYENISGLKPGRFVWNPAAEGAGPVAIVVSLHERMAHVYRSDVELAFSSIELDAGRSSSSGFYSVATVAEETSGRGRALIWRGVDLLARTAQASTAARIPEEFAGLLHDATTPGTLVIVAEHRTSAQIVHAPGPFALEIETGTVDRGTVERGGSAVGRFASPGLSRAESAPGATPGADGDVMSVVVSRADVAAYVLRNGRVVEKLPVTIDQPSLPLGSHAAMLLEGDAKRGQARWLAFGLDSERDAAHVVADRAADAMRRVRFLDRARTAELAKSMGPGAAMILVDGPGPDARQLPRTHVALLTSAETSPASDAVASETAPQAPAKLAEPAASKLPPRTNQKRGSVKAKAAGRNARTARGPLDHREPWPNSIIWPY
jgi:hypothetical protein